MRRAFIRHLGVTPGRYRERFRTAHRDLLPLRELRQSAP
jgi:AraC-like DNA-binding protein